MEKKLDPRILHISSDGPVSQKTIDFLNEMVEKASGVLGIPAEYHDAPNCVKPTLTKDGKSVGVIIVGGIGGAFDGTLDQFKEMWMNAKK